MATAGKPQGLGSDDLGEGALISDERPTFGVDIPIVDALVPTAAEETIGNNSRREAATATATPTPPKEGSATKDNRNLRNASGCFFLYWNNLSYLKKWCNFWP
jgi:hypothetical protein